MENITANTINIYIPPIIYIFGAAQIEDNKAKYIIHKVFSKEKF
jgi:hypothetical protein